LFQLFQVQDLGLAAAYSRDDGTYRYIKKTDGPALPSSTGNDPAFQRLRLKASKAALEELDQYISETWISSTVFAPPPKTGAFTVMPLGPIMMSKDGIMA